MPGVLNWPWFSEPHGYDFNGTLLLSAEGNLCVDPVDPTEEVLDRLAEERAVHDERNGCTPWVRTREAHGQAR